MHHQTCNLTHGFQAHFQHISDLINCPIPQLYTWGYRGRLRSNAAHPERRTADSFLNGKTMSPTKPHLQLATTRLRSYRQVKRSTKQPLQAVIRQPQWQAESQAFDIIGGKLIPGWGGQPNRINTKKEPQKGVSSSKIWEQTSRNTKHKTTD